MAHKGAERYAYAEKIGKQILKINGYMYETELSQREQVAAKSLRSIYSIINKSRYKQYVSIDFEHGMFELINHLNDHLGEFRFDGTYNSDPEPDHAFKTLRWKKHIMGNVLKYPKRDPNHIRETAGCKISNSNIPSEWMIRDATERDCGMDRYIEMDDK